MGTEKSLFSRIVTWTILGILAVVAIKLVLRLLGFVVGLVGAAFGIGMFLLFTVGPILLLGWILVKGWKAFAKEPAG